MSEIKNAESDEIIRNGLNQIKKKLKAYRIYLGNIIVNDLRKEAGPLILNPRIMINVELIQARKAAILDYHPYLLPVLKKFTTVDMMLELLNYEHQDIRQTLNDFNLYFDSIKYKKDLSKDRDPLWWRSIMYCIASILYAITASLAYWGHVAIKGRLATWSSEGKALEKDLDKILQPLIQEQQHLDIKP